MSSKKPVVTLLSNVNMEPLQGKLSSESKDFQFVFDGFNTIEQRISNSLQEINTNRDSTVWIHCDFNYPGIMDPLHHFRDSGIWFEMFSNKMSQWIKLITECCSCQVIFSSHYFKSYKNFSSRGFPQMELMWKCNQLLEHLIQPFPNISLFNFQEIIQDTGTALSYDDRLWTLARIPYSYPFLDTLANRLLQHLNLQASEIKKVLALDLDNTLWGGVLDENDTDEIQLGSEGLGLAYKNFQIAIRELKQRGVLLAIVSKNDANLVRDFFERNPHMVLKTEDFVEIFANWKTKSENLLHLSDKLNLNPSSFVFIDDNKRECEEVIQAIPEIVIPDFPEDPAELENWFYKEVIPNYFPVKEITDEDLNKAKQYEAMRNREHSMQHYNDYDSYLKSLQIKLDISKVDESDKLRIHQLQQKTNQFNTNKNFINASQNFDGDIWKLSYQDQFGVEGLVGAMFVESEERQLVIRQMMLSCRVLMRNVEYAFLQKVISEYQVETIRFEKTKTNRNKQAIDFIDELKKQAKTTDDFMIAGSGLLEMVKLKTLHLTYVS